MGLLIRICNRLDMWGLLTQLDFLLEILYFLELIYCYEYQLLHSEVVN